jgi:hypothetical protein
MRWTARRVLRMCHGMWIEVLDQSRAARPTGTVTSRPGFSPLSRTNLEALLRCGQGRLMGLQRHCQSRHHALPDSQAGDGGGIGTLIMQLILEGVGGPSSGFGRDSINR